VVHAYTILSTEEGEIKTIVVQNQPGQTVPETPSHKRAGGVAQGRDPEFKPQYCKKKKETKKLKSKYIK
jgi:hypothetical protein